MERVLSTYLFADQPLTPNLLANIAAAGIPAIEIYCAPFHFNYRAPNTVRELADWLGEHRMQVHALHSPMERDLLPGKRESGAPISISDPERVRRIDAVDEVKRALEVAESIPFRFLIQHLDSGRRAADQRRFDAAFNSLEHLVVFAKQRGVVIALENTPGELTSPSSLRHFIVDTRLHDLRMCFDIGHAHIEDGVETSFETMRERVVTTNVHDNHGEKDEHLLPFEGTIDWEAALEALARAPQALPIVLEPRELAANSPSLEQMTAVFDRLEKSFSAKRPVVPNSSSAGD
jgi:sugar phosphate isomerase/epimerase